MTKGTTPDTDNTKAQHAAKKTASYVNSIQLQYRHYNYC